MMKFIPPNLRRVLLAGLVIYTWLITLYLLFTPSPTPSTTFPTPSTPFPTPSTPSVGYYTMDAPPDLTRIAYLLNAPHMCHNASVITAIFVVTSYAGNFKARDAIREAYPANELSVLGVRRVFLLAWVNKSTTQTDYNSEVYQHDVVLESRLHEDIVQVDMMEAHHNLTYKNLLGHKWVGEHCSVAEFMVKMDDDVMMDVWQLLEAMLGLNSTERDMIVGHIDKTLPTVGRDINLEFHYVPFSQYPYTTYPLYAMGMMYLFTTRTAARILKASESVPYLWKDDAYITGVLADKAGIKRKNIVSKYAADRLMHCCENSVANERYMCRYIVGLVKGHGQGGDYSIMSRVKAHAQSCHRANNCQPLPLNSVVTSCVS